MVAPHTRIVFSDVDGTFLDDRLTHALPDDLVRQTFARERVVFVSSRTLEELLTLQASLRVRLDVIGENGAFIATRLEDLASGLEALGATLSTVAGMHVASLASARASVRAFVHEAIRATRSAAVVADELSPAAFVELSGHDLAAANEARRRRFSVLLHQAEPELVERLRMMGLDATSGGRWTAVIAGSNKGRAVRLYHTAAERLFGPLATVGVGDAENDASTLHSVDVAFAIKRPDGTHTPQLLAVPNVRLLTRTGSEGWQEMVELLDEEASHA